MHALSNPKILRNTFILYSNKVSTKRPYLLSSWELALIKETSKTWIKTEINSCHLQLNTVNMSLKESASTDAFYTWQK